MSVFKQVAEHVTAKDAAEVYGLKFSRNGRAVCVWHNDHKPDLAFYGSHCHCFACGNGGDSIALTAQLFNLSMLEAAAKLNADFNLGLDMEATETSTAPTQAQLRQQERERENREWGTLCEIEQQADKRLQALCKGCSDWDRIWDNPRFTKALEARSRAAIALENLRAKGGT